MAYSHTKGAFILQYDNAILFGSISEHDERCLAIPGWAELNTNEAVVNNTRVSAWNQSLLIPSDAVSMGFSKHELMTYTTISCWNRIAIL